MASILDDIAAAGSGIIGSVKRGAGAYITQGARALRDTGIDTSAAETYGNQLVEQNPASITSLGEAANSPVTALSESIASSLPAVGTALAGGKVGQIAGGIIGGAVSKGNPGAIRLGQTAGGIIGSALPDFATFYGGNRQVQDQVGVDDKGSAAIGAVGQAALNQLPLIPAKRLLRIPGGGEAATGGILREAGKFGLIGAATAPTQAAITRAQAGQSITDNPDEYALAAAQGAAAGGVLGGVSRAGEKALGRLAKPDENGKVKPPPDLTPIEQAELGHAVTPQRTVVDSAKGPLSRAVVRGAKDGAVEGGVVDLNAARASLPVHDVTSAPPEPAPQQQEAETQHAPYSAQVGDRTISFPASKSLSPVERSVEQRAAAQVLADPAKAIEDYKALPGTENGRIISTDEAREVFGDYSSGPEARSAFSFAVHEPSSWIAKEQFNQRMAQPPEEGKAPVVVFTAGGTGAGKTTAISRAPGFKEAFIRADTVYDGNLQNFDSARSKIDQALDSGRMASILYVNRDPQEAFNHGVLPRAAKENYGRTVSFDAHADTHINAAKTLAQLAEHYKDNPNVDIQVINNGKKEALAGNVTDVSRVAGMDRATLISELRNGLQQERQQGRVPDRVYNFYRDRESERAVQPQGVQQQSGVGGDRQDQLGQGGERAEGTAAPAGAQELQDAGGVRGSVRVLSEQDRSAARNSGRDDDGSLQGLPRQVGGFKASSFEPAQRAARDYAAENGRTYTPPATYAKVVPERATKIARAYDEMKHAPNDPAVQRAYKAMIDETAAQYQAMKKTGLKVEFIKPGDPDPYAGNPRKMTEDVRNNNHMWVYSTREGFGSDAKFDASENPLLGLSNEKFGDQPALHNDIFRAVHDYFGHVKEGVGFRADGEENAWRSHSAMYSEEARKAMTSETRGQNSWVNFGPHGETNRKASAADTHYADQKIGILPDWAIKEGAGDATGKPVYPLAPEGTRYREISSEEGRLSEMSPDEFLKAARPLDIDESSRDNIEALKRHIQDGGQLDPLALNRDGTEDGRHRAVAAKELGIDSVPVLNQRGPRALSGDPNKPINGKGMAPRAVGDLVSRQTKNWKSGPAVEVVSTNNDLPSALRAALGYKNVEGAYDGNGKIYVVADHINSARDVRRIIAHEAYAHYGVKGMLGDKFGEFLSRVDKLKDVDDDIRAAYQATQERYGELSPESRADEVVAHLAENYSTLKGRAKILVAQVVSAIKNFLRTKLNIQTEMSSHDVLAMIAKARKTLEKGADEVVHAQARASAGDPLFNHPPGDANAIRDGAEMPEGLKRGNKYRTREIAAALEARQRSIAGKIDRKDFSPESRDRIANWMQAEVEHELQNPDQSGAGWYSEKYQRALDHLGESFPELKTDKTARDTMTAIIAITSDGQKVYPNFKQAAHIYDNFRGTGKFTTDLSNIRGDHTEHNLGVLQRLHDAYGAEGMHDYLMQETTVKELKKLAKKAGIELNVKYQAKTKLPMAALELGPKLGAFYANLMGSHGYLTMDRWWSRTFNRYRGDILPAPTKSGVKRLKELLGNPKMSDDEAISASVEHAQNYKAKGYKKGTELEVAANTVWKAAGESLNDTPFGAKDRTFMIDTVDKMRDNMAKAGKEISSADVQAILWYYEKRLYGELGARPSADTSYEEVAKRVVAERADRSVGPTALAAGVRAESAYPTPSGALRKAGEAAGVRASVPAPADSFDGWTRPSGKLDRYLSQSAGERIKAYMAVAGQQGDKLRTMFQDYFLPVKRTQEAIEQRGGTVDDSSDVYGREELYYGRTGSKLDALERDHVKPLVQEIAKSGVSLDDAELYLYAKFAPERNARIASINPELQDGGSGMTNADAAKIIDDFKKQGVADKLDKVADRVYALNEERVKALEESGLLSAEEAKAWREDKHYVPLKGFAEGVDDEAPATRPPVGAGFSVGGREAWRALGRRSRAADLIANAIAQTDQAIIRGEKNRVAQALLKLAQDNPNKALWDVDATQRKAGFDKSTGEVVYRHAPEPDAVVAKVNGEEYRINIRDQRFLEAMKNMGSAKVGAVLRSFGAINRVLSLTRTSYSPEFVLSNLARDIQTAATNLTGLIDAKTAAKAVTVNMPHAMKAMWGQLSGKKVGGEWARWAQEFSDSGGMTHFVNQKSVEQQQSHLEGLIRDAHGGTKANAKKMLRGVADYINQVNSTIENGTRLSAYAEARRAGMSMDQAARLAKNLTVNFNRKGQVGAAMNAMWLFYNASIQGAHRFMSAMKSPKVQGIMAATSALGFGLGYYNRVVGGKDEDGQDLWDKVPDWEKQRNLYIMDAFGRGNNLKVPMPYTYNLPYLIGQNAADMVFGKKSASSGAAALTNALINAFDPIGSIDITKDPTQQIVKAASPTVLQPFADLAFNRSYFDSPILPDQDPHAKVPTPDSERFFKGSTNPNAVALARELNRLTGGNPVRSGGIDVSPASMQYLLDYLTGGSGSFVERSVTAATLASQGKDVPVHKIPFVRTFLSQLDDRRVNDTYYTARDDVNQKAEMAKVARKPGAFPDATAAEREEMAFGARLAGPLSTIENQLGKIRKAKLLAQSKGNDDEVDRLDKVSRQLMTRFNKAYFEAKERAQ